MSGISSSSYTLYVYDVSDEVTSVGEREINVFMPYSTPILELSVRSLQKLASYDRLANECSVSVRPTV